jgi:hypothetical protein
MSTPPGASARLAEFVKPFNRAERLAGSGCLVLLVSMFLTWKSLNAPAGAGSGFPTAGVNGFHGWGLITLLLVLATSAFVLARSPFFRNTVALPRLPLADGPLLIVAGAAELFTILLFSSEYGEGRHARVGMLLAIAGAALTAAGGYWALRAAQGARTYDPGAAATRPTDEHHRPQGGGPPEPFGGGPPQPLE